MGRTGYWYFWNGTRWELDPAAGSHIDEVAERYADLLSIKPYDKDLAKAVQSLKSMNAEDSTLGKLKNLPGVRMKLSDFDQNLDLLQVSNGVVDLRTGALLEPRKEDLISQVIEIDFDANATCPVWDKFLTEIFIHPSGETDHEAIEYFQRCMGYGISGSVQEEMFLILWGDGSNGKGTIQNTFEGIFGPIAKHASFSTFEATRTGTRNDLAALRSARYVFAAEGKPDTPLAVELVKGIAGADPITARFLYGEDFTFMPRFLLLLSTNNKPVITDQNMGIWRKIKLLHLRRQFADDEVDNTLKARLLTEAEGILSWVVAGAVAWNQPDGGLKTKVPDSVRDSTMDFKTESDVLKPFIQDQLKVSEGNTVTFKAVWDTFKDWRQEEDDKTLQMMKRAQFKEAMRQIGYNIELDHRLQEVLKDMDVLPVITRAQRRMKH